VGGGGVRGGGVAMSVRGSGVWCVVAMSVRAGVGALFGSDCHKEEDEERGSSHDERFKAALWDCLVVENR
jgi:hypothetical protein